MNRHYYLITLFLFACLSVSGNLSSATADLEELVPKESSGGWTLRAAPQIFTRKTLFEHINGQADLFFQYGFERSIFAVYLNRSSGQERIDLDIYDMGTVVNAFGIFSRFRQEASSARIGLDSYMEDHYALFYKGKYFVVIQGNETGSSDLKQLAEITESRIVDRSTAPKEIAYFPRNGLKPGSIEYFPQGLLGREFLKKGFKAAYVVTDKAKAKPDAVAESPDSNLFIAVFDNPREALSALKTYREDLSKKGRAETAISTRLGSEILTGEDPYQGKIIVAQKGLYLIGAVGFEEQEDGLSLLAELIRRIE